MKKLLLFLSLIFLLCIPAFAYEKNYIDVTSTSQDLSAASLDTVTSFNKDFRLLGVYYHFDGSNSETITITKDSNQGASYDTVLAENTLSTETDYVFRPTGNEIFVNGDELQVETTSGTVTVYVTIYTEEY